MAYVNKISANKEVWINTFTYKYIHTYLIINDKLQKLTWQKKKHEQTEMLNIDIYINIYSSYIYYTNKHSIDITYIHTSVLYVFWFLLLRFKTKVMNKSLTRFKVRFYSASFWWQKINLKNRAILRDCYDMEENYIWLHRWKLGQDRKSFWNGASALY